MQFSEIKTLNKGDLVFEEGEKSMLRRSKIGSFFYEKVNLHSSLVFLSCASPLFSWFLTSLYAALAPLSSHFLHKQEFCLLRGLALLRREINEVVNCMVGWRRSQRGVLSDY